MQGVSWADAPQPLAKPSVITAPNASSFFYESRCGWLDCAAESMCESDEAMLEAPLNRSSSQYWATCSSPPPPPPFCSLPEFSPLVLGAATTLLEPPAQKCNVVKWVLVNGLLVSFVLVSSGYSAGRWITSRVRWKRIRIKARNLPPWNLVITCAHRPSMLSHNAHKQTYTNSNTNTNTNTMLTRKLTQTQTQTHWFCCTVSVIKQYRRQL